MYIKVDINTIQEWQRGRFLCKIKLILLFSQGTFFISPFVLEIRKVLSKLSKEKGCEVLSPWIKSCENHLYWSAASTYSGNGLVIWAKFKAFMSHVVNKHSSLSDPLFNKCGHGVIHPRKWLSAGVYHWCIVLSWVA